MMELALILAVAAVVLLGLAAMAALVMVARWASTEVAIRTAAYLYERAFQARKDTRVADYPPLLGPYAPPPPPAPGSPGSNVPDYPPERAERMATFPGEPPVMG